MIQEKYTSSIIKIMLSTYMVNLSLIRIVVLWKIRSADARNGLVRHMHSFHT